MSENKGLDESIKQEILSKARVFIKDEIASAHERKTKELKSLDAFNVNPFLIKYIAQFTFGDSSSTSLAKSLIYPRALGTSITTIFGTRMQQFCNRVLKDSFPTVIGGLDIEFIDAEDGFRKYCQVKAGPNCINRDDKITIRKHFDEAINRGRVNGIRIPKEDCVLGVLYSSFEDTNQFYKDLANEGYSVLVGKEFWYHLTGDDGFYDDLISAFAEAVIDLDRSKLLEKTIKGLASEIENKGLY